MKVVATSPGFYKGERKRVGDEFEFTGKKLGKWMEKVEGDKPKTSKKEAREPQSMSELNKQTTDAEKTTAFSE